MRDVSQLLERAARAAFDAYWAGRDSDPDSQEYWWQNSKENFIDETRAVLMAVREPDESSRECAKCAADPDWLISGDAAGKVFTAMIDAILEGK